MSELKYAFQIHRTTYLTFRNNLLPRCLVSFEVDLQSGVNLVINTIYICEYGVIE